MSRVDRQSVVVRTSACLAVFSTETADPKGREMWLDRIRERARSARTPENEEA